MIKQFTPGRETEIHALVKSVFDEFVGHEYPPEGNNEFYRFIEPEKILERHKTGGTLLVHEEEGTIRGVIEVRDENHICLFFVDKKYHDRGIGRGLFEAVRGILADRTDYMDVNASPYSEEIYARLGFVKTGEAVEQNGMRFIPMKIDM